jgi:tetratricopeptide (TPR) repeat protein
MSATWRIELLGELRAVQDGRVVTRFRSQKTALLLAYLAYHLHRPHRRAQLCELLWPEGDPQTALANLRNTLRWLRQALEPPGVPAGTLVMADRATIRLNPDAVTTDVAEFDAALQAAARAGSHAERAQCLARAVELFCGELLAGHHDGWVLQERQWLAERYFQALGSLISYLEQAGDLEGALEYARRAAYQQGDLQQARRRLEEAVLYARERARPLVSIDLAELLAGLGERGQARALFAESLAALRRSRNYLGVSHLLARQGRVELRHGEWKRAAVSYLESLCLLQERGVREGVPDCLEGVAGVALAAGVEEAARPADGQPAASDEPSHRSPWPSHSGSGARLAARLLGAAEAMREAMGAPLPPIYWPDHERMVACLQVMLGEQELASEWGKGRAMSPEEAAVAALELLYSASPTELRQASEAT